MRTKMERLDDYCRYCGRILTDEETILCKYCKKRFEINMVEVEYGA